MLMNAGMVHVTSKNNLLTTVGWTLDHTDYMLEGSVFMAGATLQWLRDGFGIINNASEAEALANSVPDTSGAMFVPAFTGLGAPYWDPYARSTLVGLTRGTRKAHIVRAALQAIAYQSADLVDAMEKDITIKLSELRVDGGASRNDFLMQFQADILDAPVVRPIAKETTSLGAAYLAGLAVGFWQSTQEIAEQWRAERTFVQRMTEDERNSRMHHCRCSVVPLFRCSVVRSQLWVEP